MCALPALPNSASPSIARSSRSTATTRSPVQIAPTPPQRSAPIASRTDPRRPASARIRRHSGSADAGSAIASTVAGSTVNVPRSKAGISSPANDSSASARARRQSPPITATASDGDRRQGLRPRPAPARALAPRFELGEVSRIGDPEEHADDADRPQRELEVLLGLLGQRRVDDRHRARRVLHEQQRAREHHRGHRPRGGIGQRRIGLGQRLGRRGPADELRGRAELERQGGADLRRRRLQHRALQVRQRAVRRAALDRDRRRRAQPLDHPGVRPRRREHQLRGDPLGRGAQLREQARGPRVLEPAPRRRELEVDRVAHERVDEALVGAQDLGARRAPRSSPPPPSPRRPRAPRSPAGRAARPAPRPPARRRARAPGAAPAAAAPCARPPAARSPAPTPRATHPAARARPPAP